MRFVIIRLARVSNWTLVSFDAESNLCDTRLIVCHTIRRKLTRLMLFTRLCFFFFLLSVMSEILFANLKAIRKITTAKKIQSSLTLRNKRLHFDKVKYVRIVFSRGCVAQCRTRCILTERPASRQSRVSVKIRTSNFKVSMSNSRSSPK